jgi:hypothetical protein
MKVIRYSKPFKLQLVREVETGKIALRLRNETTISLKWIASRLEMGSWVHTANRIYESQKPK